MIIFLQKNQRYWLISPKHIANQRILQSDWPRNMTGHTQQKIGSLRCYLFYFMIISIQNSISISLYKWLPLFQCFSPKHWMTGLVYSRISLTSWRDVCLALVDHPSSHGNIKIPYGLDVLLNQPAWYPIFSYWVD